VLGFLEKSKSARPHPLLPAATPSTISSLRHDSTSTTVRRLGRTSLLPKREALVAGIDVHQRVRALPLSLIGTNPSPTPSSIIINLFHIGNSLHNLISPPRLHKYHSETLGKDELVAKEGSARRRNRCASTCRSSPAIPHRHQPVTDTIKYRNQPVPH
jgi:hypothetical protein